MSSSSASLPSAADQRAAVLRRALIRAGIEQQPYLRIL